MNSTPAKPAPVTPQQKSKFPITAVIDLGVIYQRDSAHLNAWIKNQGDKAIVVTKIKSSCECLDVQLSKMQFAPGERVLAKLHYDGQKEPDFVGSLLISVELTDDQGRQVGEIEAPIEVIRAKPAADAGAAASGTSDPLRPLPEPR